PPPPRPPLFPYTTLFRSLCPAAGLPKPALVVLDDPAPNALACGRRPRDAALVVTQGLLDKLSRIELEGVLAHELSHVKALDILRSEEHTSELQSLRHLVC